MRHAGSNRRSTRNRGNNGGGGRGSSRGNRMPVFDSNGPDVRIRGTAHQICEKYVALAKDAASSGDAILSESYLQHAEHYQRTINQWQDNNSQVRPEGQESDSQGGAKGNGKAYDETNISGPERGNEKEDLSLPASILGERIKHESEEDSAVRVSSREGILEDV
ncbi:MAG: DUF4167 domain-containing protein [Rhodospirillales bacterium]|nr:DUF4167 domain-containing protein [Alphaproteobacteria bacterium]USO03168.1 MAG: DUF4167 domain-containing protein [Rhodospirillales bacterium]